MDAYVKLILVLWSIIFVCFVVFWARKRLEKPTKYSDALGFIILPIFVIIFFIPFLIYNCDPYGLFYYLMNNVNNPPDADYYSQITAFIGVLFGVSMPVGFQIIGDFGNKYNNSLLSKLAVNKIKDDVALYSLYTLLTMISGVVFSYYKNGSQLSFIIISLSAFLSFSFFTVLFLELRKIMVDSDYFAHELVKQKAIQAIKNVDNDVYNEIELNKIKELVALQTDLLIPTITSGNFLKLKVDLGRFLHFFLFFVIEYEKSGNTFSISDRFNFSSDSSEFNKELLHTNTEMLREILIRTNKLSDMEKREIFRVFERTLYKDRKSEESINRFVNIMHYIYSMFLYTQRSDELEYQFIERFEWAIQYYFGGYKRPSINTISKNTLAEFIGNNIKYVVINSDNALMVKRIIRELSRANNMLIIEKNMYSIAYKYQLNSSRGILDKINNIYNQNTFVLNTDNLSELRGLLDEVVVDNPDDKLKVTIDEYYLLAYECHKRFLVANILFRSITLCIVLEKYDIAKAIIKEHFKDIKGNLNYQRLLPENANETLELYNIARQLHYFQDFDDEITYRYELTTCLFLLKHWSENRKFMVLPDFFKGSELNVENIDNFFDKILMTFDNSNILKVLYNILAIEGEFESEIKTRINELKHQARVTRTTIIETGDLDRSKLINGFEIAQESYNEGSSLRKILKDNGSSSEAILDITKSIGNKQLMPREMLLQSNTADVTPYFAGLGREFMLSEDRDLYNRLYDKCEIADSILSAFYSIEQTEKTAIFVHESVLTSVLYNDSNFIKPNILEKTNPDIEGRYKYREKEYNVYLTYSSKYKNFIMVVDLSTLEFIAGRLEYTELEPAESLSINNFSESNYGPQFEVIDTLKEESENRIKEVNPDWFSDLQGNELKEQLKGKFFFRAFRLFDLSFSEPFKGYKIIYPSR